MNPPMQTYCTKTDIEAIWPPASLLASVDDDSTGTLSATEDGYITRAIERAANLINSRLAMRYKLADLAANTWCRDANAAIAAYWLSTRRSGTRPGPPSAAIRRLPRRARPHRHRPPPRARSGRKLRRRPERDELRDPP